MNHPQPIDPTKLRRTIFAGAIGNAIEFYDFIIYAYLAVYFAYHFLFIYHIISDKYETINILQAKSDL